jgi:hypothetical protein
MTHSPNGTQARKMKAIPDGEYVQTLWEVKLTKEVTKSIIEGLALLYSESCLLVNKWVNVTFNFKR